ncbi:hypothetical protein [Streptomyces chiangmaiensis]|uniref:Secreted protein n=1 Tax=Streptomyces chiangmaiensis TaxID=766497 RepID=A0ABU7FLU5_9ACTN|nr:hypothetical protein [Streptomyces chiangmaiensis]MED7825095.1 hypothetical protein [Streptomyces chiangmaiensis]
MSENQDGAEPVGQAAGVGPVEAVPSVVNAEPVAASPAEFVASVEFVAPSPAKKAVRRGRVAVMAGSVLLAGAVVAGAGFTVVTVRNADHDPGAPVWKLPDDKEKKKKRTATASGLAGMLVPYDTDGWVRGPDLGEFGSDTQLSGAQATALSKESLRDLPRSQRRQLEKQIDRQHITGMAMRSYYNADGSNLSGNEGIFTVSIVLSRMESRAAVRDIWRFESKFLDALDILRDGPTITGHKNAKCFLPPKDADADLDSMYCSAYVGDVLVTATADGVKPLDTKGVAMLLRTQLDRIAEPGEAV